MKQLSFTLEDNNDLSQFLGDPELTRLAPGASAMLVQLYSAYQDPKRLEQIASETLNRFPQAQVVGATTVGEIHQGHTQTGTTVIGVTLFESSGVEALFLPCARGKESQAGRELGQLLAQRLEVAGLLLLTTSTAFNTNTLISELGRTSPPFPVFGGGAADYGKVKRSLVVHQDKSHESGVVAVIFKGTDLKVDCHSYLGWRALSKPMIATEVKDLTLKLLDNRPAFEVLSRYLNITNDDSFHLSALEFPLMVTRGEHTLARTPIAVGRGHSIEFFADIKQGEQVRLGYGDPRMIIRDARQVHRKMAAFAPEAVFLYSCGCRRFLMQEQVEMETQPFQQLAPTTGFYTYGEFFGNGEELLLLNSTMVAVGMREGDADAERVQAQQSLEDASQERVDDPYANQHIRIMERLMHFIDAVTDELQQASHELEEKATVDKLTQLPNRVQLEELLTQEILHEERYGRPFSLILLDIDSLSEINDRHGRLIGDEVVSETAQLLNAHTRRTDLVGRWEGGTFMVILPDTQLAEAKVAAIKLYAMFGQTHFTHGEHCTASLGVAQYPPGYALEQMVSRVRQSLSRAKQAGGDQVNTLN
ncbi:sensor domain-containing diguanylate cyclase [Ferrimonas futtsuensis]|uniref:sensor domain-containing diguanylate cyclase n=1 Tax=Ferrimonas futtsuensis TaxID=364764 RepID=UPI00041B3DE3|nr:diguanylate cyclase [Ferrimonas futtsuensis]